MGRNKNTQLTFCLDKYLAISEELIAALMNRRRYANRIKYALRARTWKPLIIVYLPFYEMHDRTTSKVNKWP